MIIGKQFAWGHLPKTGGDATLHFFRLFPELIVYADSECKNIKHNPFHTRQEEVAGKLLVLNIRRLPSWILSYEHQIARNGTYPDYRPGPMASSDEMAETDIADRMIKWFTNQGNIKIDRWFRTEYLYHDLLQFVSEFTKVSVSQIEQIAGLKMVNMMQYVHDISKWFTKDQVERMYSNNPLWAFIEQEVYGCQVNFSRLGNQRLAKAVNNGPYSAYQRLTRHVLEAANEVMPDGTIAAVVSKGDKNLVELGGERKGWHFPRNEDGVYVGYHPADSAEAISHLEELREKGAQFLLFPGTALWWLEHYGEFRDHLDSRYRRVQEGEECVIYSLCEYESAGQGDEQ
jgi:hypothetical protein